VVKADRRNPSHKAFGGPSYQLQYEFRAPSRLRAFGYTGQMLFTDRWVRVDEGTWSLARATGKLPVRYALSDPRVNAPTSVGLPSAIHPVVFSAISILSFVLAAVALRKVRAPLVAGSRGRWKDGG